MNIQSAFNQMLGQIGTITQLGKIAENTKEKEEQKAQAKEFNQQMRQNRLAMSANQLAISDQQVQQAKMLSLEMKKARRDPNTSSLERVVGFSQAMQNQQSGLQQRKELVKQKKKKVNTNG